MCSRVISSSAPNGSPSGERRVRCEARAIATRCCMPPDSCHVKCSANSGSLTSSSISSARRAACLVPLLSSRGGLHVLGHRSPLEQAGLLERHPVVLIQPRRPGRLAVDMTAPVVGSVRFAITAAASTSAAGGTDQRDELARADRQVDVDQGLDASCGRL